MKTFRNRPGFQTGFVPYASQIRCYLFPNQVFCLLGPLSQKAKEPKESCFIIVCNLDNLFIKTQSSLMNLFSSTFVARLQITKVCQQLQPVGAGEAHFHRITPQFAGS